MTKKLKLCTFIFSFIYSAYSFSAVKYNIDGITDEAKSNVEIYLQSLDAPKQADNKDYLDEVKKSAMSALSVFGYYQPDISITVKDDSPEQTVNLLIDIGPPTLITTSNITLIGEGKNDVLFTDLLQSFSLSEGSILKHVNYESAKSSLKSLARRYGYFDAQFNQSSVQVQSLNNSASVLIEFDTGPRYQFGELVFEESSDVDKFIVSLKNFELGEPYDARVLSEFNADLNQTGYFKSITILPEFSNKQGLNIPLQVLATMRPQDSFTSGLGYSTDEGIRGKFGWSRPWINRFGHSIEANIVASVPEQEVSLNYEIPLEDPLYNYLSLQYGYKKYDQNDTDTSQYVIGVNRFWRLENNWIRNIFIRYDHETGLQGQQTFTNALVIPGVSYSRTRTRGGINTTWGDKLLASLEVANEWWLSSDDVVKVYGQAKFLRTYEGHQFIASAELGALQVDSIYSVPSSMRFFTGGDQSVRGFDYESIAPEDDDGFLIGGKFLTVGSLEYRYPVAEKWKLAVFTDVGTATDDFSEELSSSAGAGVIWASPVGPIRFYVAKPITNEINSFAIHFMIGPEL